MASVIDLFSGDEKLARVVGLNFVAGLVVVDDRCVACAPILHKTCKWRTSAQLRALFAARGWRATIVSPGHA